MAYTRKLGAMAKYTSYLTLPREFVSSLGWRRGQKITIAKRNGAIVIRDARRRPASTRGERGSPQAARTRKRR